MTEQEAQIGVIVQTPRAFCGVPAGSIGVIDQDYGTGVMVAWDVPQGILPAGYRKYDGKWAVHTGIIRDGFDKKTELDLLNITTTYRKGL